MQLPAIDRCEAETRQSALFKQKRGSQNRPRFQDCSVNSRVLRTATPATYTTAISASAVPFATAESANTTTAAATAAPTIAPSAAPSVTTSAMTTTIVARSATVNQCQTFNGCCLNRGLRKVTGCDRRGLYTCHRNQTSEGCQSDCQQEFLHCMLLIFEYFLLTPCKLSANQTLVSHFLNFC